MRHVRLQELTLISLGCFIGLFGQVYAANGETVGERFEKAMKKKAEYCATHKIDPANHRCDITKLQSADPLATEEGRFAHSIKIPNPVPEDSGYKLGMTPEQYFDHLCKTESGEFIYKTVEDVEGLYMMRLRDEAHFEYNHLYALEDPYGHWNQEATEPEMLFVRPSWYSFLETPFVLRNIPHWKREKLHPSMLSIPPSNRKYLRFLGYDGQDLSTMQKVYDTSLKSRYGYVWRGVVRPHDRELGIAGGELIIVELEAGEVLGVYRGYSRFDIDKSVAGTAAMQWRQRCPSPSQNFIAPYHEFIRKVLRPVRGSSVKNGGSHATK